MPENESSENRALRAKIFGMEERAEKEKERRKREKEDRLLRHDAYEPRFDVIEQDVKVIKAILEERKPATQSATALEVVEKKKKRLRPEVAQSLSLAGGGGVIVLLTELVRWVQTWSF